MRARSSPETSPISIMRVDEEAQARFRGQAAGAGVGSEDQARRLQIRHDIADRGGRERHRQDARRDCASRRARPCEIALDDLPEDLAGTVVQLRDGAGVGQVEK